MARSGSEYVISERGKVVILPATISDSPSHTHTPVVVRVLVCYSGPVRAANLHERSYQDVHNNPYAEDCTIGAAYAAYRTGSAKPRFMCSMRIYPCSAAPPPLLLPKDFKSEVLIRSVTHHGKNGTRFFCDIESEKAHNSSRVPSGRQPWQLSEHTCWVLLQPCAGHWSPAVAWAPPLLV